MTVPSRDLVGASHHQSVGAMADPVEPSVHVVDDGDTVAVLVWRFAAPRAVLSSATVGGGWRTTSSVVNIGVVDGYRRTDLDRHALDIAEAMGVLAPVAMLTAADVRRVVRGVDAGVVAHATVGITKPTWAADADGAFHRRVDGGWAHDVSTGAPPLDDQAYRPGTINVVVQVPVPLTRAALTNAVITATEAKSQALFEADIPGTGTASDAVTIVAPIAPAEVEVTGRAASSTGPEPFAGPRSPWGARIGRAVHAAIAEGWRRHP